MLAELLGSKNRERVLIYILTNKEGYAKEISDFYESSLDPIQKQLERLESASVLVSKKVGRTRVFMFNPRYAFEEPLKVLLQKAVEFYPPQEIERLTMKRKRPRRKDKPL
jgi:predicted transcriptional regulator